MAVLDAIPDKERELKFFPAETTNPQKLTMAEVDKFNEKGYIFPVHGIRLTIIFGVCIHLPLS